MQKDFAALKSKNSWSFWAFFCVENGSRDRGETGVKNMQFQTIYEEKKRSAAEVAAMIPDASHIFSDIFLAQPKTLYEAINNRCLADSMRSCTITTYLDLYPLVCYTEPIRFAKNLQGTSVFCSGLTRKAVGQGLADYLPNTYWDQPALIRDYLDVDVL